MTTGYIELHAHSAYSFLDGASLPEELAVRAAELGYEVTVVKDATADYSDAEMHAALEINIPNYASTIVTTAEVVDAISSL